MTRKNDDFFILPLLLNALYKLSTRQIQLKFCVDKLWMRVSLERLKQFLSGPGNHYAFEC